MSNTISSWFIPFWYSAAGGEITTPEMINKKREELKAKNELPSFPNPKSLTPCKSYGRRSWNTCTYSCSNRIF